MIDLDERTDLPKIDACHVCRNWHFNACPALWGGNPEMVPVERRAGWPQNEEN
jgi:hypothetical protein